MMEHITKNLKKFLDSFTLLRKESTYFLILYNILHNTYNESSAFEKIMKYSLTN